MKTHSIILIISLIITTGCLGVGYIFAGYWLILPVLLLILLIWIYVGIRQVIWPASSLLLATVLLAAIGITVDLSSILMIIACTTALVSWDLAHFNHSTTGTSLDDTKRSLERYHLQSLTLAASAGLILALASTYFNLRFPFVVIIFLVFMTMGSLIFSVQYILKMKL